MKNVLLILMALLTGGCATTGKYEANLKSWVGHPSGELVRAWGIPTKSMDVPGGGRAYEYVYVNGSRQLANTTYNQFTNSLDTSTTTNAFYCKTTFFTDTKDIVTNWQWEGNSCRAE